MILGSQASTAYVHRSLPTVKSNSYAECIENCFCLHEFRQNLRDINN